MKKEAIPTPPDEINDVGAGDFYAIGKEFLKHAITQGGMRPDDRVIEPGCGVGRIASGLVEYLKHGSYEGFDVVKPPVDWCQQEITSRHPNFRFTHADVHNVRYNKHGTINAADFRFPYGREFDFAILTSVFTHLLPDQVDHYLGELARVLKPGRRTLITWALLDDEAKRLIAEGKSHRQVPYDRGHYRLHSESVPEALIAYDEKFALSLYQKHGFKIASVFHGEWCGKRRVLSWQDVVIATSPA
jgi:SAM-dependent methyltransferase